MIRHPQCDNDNCETDGGRWVHVPECSVAANASVGPWGEDMALTTAREDGYAGWFPRQQNRRAA
jgi:hypothetical protein